MRAKTASDPRPPGRHLGARLDNRYVLSVQALLAFGYGELNPLPILQRTIPVTAYGTKMYEHIIALVALDKTIPLSTVEPLHRTLFTF